MLPEPIRVAYQVAMILDNLDIPYFLGGSLASITHGILRTTQDADIIADIQTNHIPALMKQLSDDFYIDEELLKRSVSQRGSLNILHRVSLFKVDIFLTRNTPFEKSQFQRARLHSMGEGQKNEAKIATAEDILLAKLVWYRQGRQVSERQWRDALGIVKVQGKSLDLEYLHRWASELNVSDLLAKLLKETKTE